MPATVQKYEIQHNGGRTFDVHVHQKTKRVEIFIVYYDFDEDKCTVSSMPVLTLQPEHVWVGNSPKNPMTKFSGGYGKKWDGNTLLLVMDGLTHVAIVGDKVYSFEALAPICQYVSPIGNNYVPYPYACDTVGNVYLLEEKVARLHPVPDFTVHGDPYTDYYENSATEFNGVATMQVGKKKFNLSYTTDAAATYQELTKHGKKSMVLTGPTTPAKVYTEEEFVAFMVAFGAALHVQALKTKDLVLHE